ncbi:pol polyprotein, partial [Trifolium medium]|nr:pol polyprotein [Trifolium medium]
MFFYLILKKVVNVLNEDMPIVPAFVGANSGTNQTLTINGESSEKSDAAVGKQKETDFAAQIKAQELQLKKEQQLWLDNDYLCKGYIINGLCDELYDYYCSYKTAKEVWEALKKKYDTEEAGVKKYAVSRYLKYQMVDESWKEFKNQLRHKTKEFSIESLITRLRIEEESRRQDQKEDEKTFMVSSNKKKFGHYAKKCRLIIKVVGAPNAQANQVEEPYVAMITEINMVGGTDGWWIDTGATRHVCYERVMFKTYTSAENKKVQMGNAHTSEVAGIGDVELKFTSGKTLILKDVMHVPDMRKNLVSGFLLNKAGFNQVIEANLYTITKNGIFIGKG